MPTLPPTAARAAAVCGVGWIIKIATITARDASFDPLESVIYFIGLAGILVALGATARDVTRRVTGRVRRPAAAVAATIGLFLATVAVTAAGDALAAALYDGANLGVNEEAGLFAVALLALGAAAATTVVRSP